LYNIALRNVTALATLNPGGKSPIDSQQVELHKMNFNEKNKVYKRGLTKR
jgi:hypothetical protein